jgi:hypothetical protein
MEDETAVRAFVEAVPSPRRRQDAQTLLEMMSRVTGQPPRLSGTIIAFGQYHYRYASGREGDGPAAAFSPRTAATTIYLPDGVGAYGELLAELGPHTTGVGCLYLKDLSTVDLGILERILAESYRTVAAGIYGNRARESAEGRPEGAGGPAASA